MNRGGLKTRTSSGHRRALMRMLALVTADQDGALTCADVVDCCVSEGLTPEECVDLLADMFAAGAVVQHEDGEADQGADPDNPFARRVGEADAIGRVRAGLETLWSRAEARASVTPGQTPAIRAAARRSNR